VLVHRPGDDLLARSGFPEQQHRRVAAGDEAGPRHHRGEAGIAADEALFAEARVAVDQLLGGETALRGRAQFL
jgi:hypothetical protein